MFYPRPQQKTGEDIIILSHGSYLPLHGLDTIIYAAQILQKYPHLRFRTVGRGIDYERITKLAETLRLNNIEFIDSVPPDQLPEMIAQADICLGGHFGKSDKAARVIAGKTFQDIAMGKATIVGDTPANRELLTHNVDAWFCPTGNPNALADGILTLAEDHELRLTIGQNAYRTFLQQASSQVLIPKIKILVDLLVGW